MKALVPLQRPGSYRNLPEPAWNLPGRLQLPVRRRADLRYPRACTLNPACVSPHRSPPEDHHSPLDLRGQDDMKLLEEYTGEKYKPSKYWAEFSPSDAEVYFQVSAPRRAALRCAGLCWPCCAG